MDESRKRAASTANAKSSSLGEDFGNDFLSSWKLPKSGNDTIDFDVESVPKNSKKFSFDNLDDFGLDGAFDKLSSFKMGMSDLDFSGPLKKKVKPNNSNGNDLSEGIKGTEKDNFSFSFDFNELGKFNLDANLGIEENGMSKFVEKVNPVSSEGDKDPRKGLSVKGSDVLGGNISKEQKQTHDACTLRPTHLRSFSPARMDQNKVDLLSTDTHEEKSNETHPSRAAVNKPSQNLPCSSTPGEDPTHVTTTAVAENCREAPLVELSKVHISRGNNDSGQSVSSQFMNTSTTCPSISRKLTAQSDSQNDQNEIVGESACLNAQSPDNQRFRGTSMKLLKKTSCETKKAEKGTSGPKSLSSSMQRESTQANARSERPKIASSKTFCKPALHELLTTSMNAKDHKNSKLGLESPSTGNVSTLNAPSSPAHSNGHKTVASRSLLGSTNVFDAGKGTPKVDNRPLSQLKAAKITKAGTISSKSDLLLEKDMMETSGRKGSPVTTSNNPKSYGEGKYVLPSPSMMQKTPKESASDPKAPAMLKHIMKSPAVRTSPETVSELGNKTIPGGGTPKARMDNAIASAISCEMGEISELELPALLENDVNVQKAEACRKELEDLCISLKRKHEEAKELAVRAIVNNNTMLMLNHPIINVRLKWSDCASPRKNTGTWKILGRAEEADRMMDLAEKMKIVAANTGSNRLGIG
uniref:Uncharacterized protein n=1 Tax=Oryza rufipogon TaxID=4529 RepID=A0A0E0N2K9_ORYRU